MTLRDGIDEEKLAEVGLALLWLGVHGDDDYLRAWKGMDWDLLDLLHEKGWITNHVGKQKSVVLSPEGAKLAKQYFEKHFAHHSEK